MDYEKHSKRLSSFEKMNMLNSVDLKKIPSAFSNKILIEEEE
jgi:hypothetical protein